MSEKYRLPLDVIFYIAILCLWTSCERSTPRKKWEYKVVTFQAIYVETSIASSKIDSLLKKLRGTTYSPSRTGSDAFHYATVQSDSLSETLRELGQQGWELVSSFLELETAYPNFGSSQYVTGLQPNIRPQRLVIMLKRPSEEK